MKIKFKGKSDYNFKKGKTYQLVKFEIAFYQIKAYISNNDNEIVYIPYSSLDTFNCNWEVVNEQSRKTNKR